ncbi:hypothetical protein SAMN05421748_110265 [Paractinoplanes atraurantiacus]|uniref:Uncharacterized protein n=1 Tax=Paractinoplanes atraurantiacus TaxID=1036182 RepID=A0A285IQJ7_9ACTN|nr:hypothetical protein SAMN05421748_110265 [Actinoplanes atraurantiacus]
MRERYSDAAVGKVLRTWLVGNELTHRMNNGPLKARDGPCHIRSNREYGRTATPAGKPPVMTLIFASYVRFGKPEGNRTVAQSYGTLNRGATDRCFTTVSRECRSWASAAVHSSGVRALTAQDLRYMCEDGTVSTVIPASGTGIRGDLRCSRVTPRTTRKEAHTETTAIPITNRVAIRGQYRVRCPSSRRRYDPAERYPRRQAPGARAVRISSARSAATRGSAPGAPTTGSQLRS